MKKLSKIIFSAIAGLAIAEMAFSQSIAEGKKAPNFSIVASDGAQVKLSNYKGKALLLHFWATWCPPCRKELPSMEKFSQRTSEKNSRIAFFAICVSDTEKNRATFMKQNKYTFAGALDERGDVALKYGVQGIPTSVLISPDGIVEKIHVGMMSESQLDTFTKKYAN